MITEEERDQQFELVVLTMQKFEQGSLAWERIRSLRDWCNRRGALRELFPPGTEGEEALWNGLVNECRRMVQ